jgi:putative transcriptional regulator
MMSSDLLAPGYLVASPRLDGSLFERSVICMVQHGDEGAMGFIVNKPLDVDFGSLLEMVELEGGDIAPECYLQDVYFGGPVRVEQLWVIYNGVLAATAPDEFASLEQDGEVRFHDEWALSGTADSIESFAFGREDNPFRPFVGYAGWGPGQLEKEIGEGSWLMLDFDEDLVLAPGGSTWETALERLGVDETTFMMMGKGGLA